MAKLKLPDLLKSWKVLSSLPEKNGNKIYSVSKKESNGTVTKAILTCVKFNDEEYNDNNIQFVNEEAAFIKNVIKCDNISNYIDAVVSDKPSKSELCLYVITEDISSLSEVLKNKKMNENDILDFGLQMSSILNSLEEKNIFHGNIKPENIFVDGNGKYKLGGFTDFESTIDDLSFTAPEIHNNEQPDYTTDIYSIGLIMYSMCNNGALPFESDAVSREEAIQKRFDKKAVQAPENASEKLKSVIVIACQPDNTNRWKNAGNLKNALSSIKAETVVETAPKEKVIAPESTDFDGNVFEEFVYDDFEETENYKMSADTTPTAESSSVTPQITEEAKEEAPESQEDSETYSENKSYKEPDIDNRVFDDYEFQTKVFNLNDAEKNNSQDYGEYFEDENAEQTETSDKDNDNVEDDFDTNGFYDDEYNEEKQSKKGIVIIVISAIVIIALLATIGIVAASNGFFSPGESKDPSNTEATTQAIATTSSQKATAQPTTSAQETTVEPTTDGNMLYPTAVLGVYFDDAKRILEEQGFVVIEGEHAYSKYYGEGIVMTMEPDETVLLEKGSTITLYVSDGLAEEQTEPEDEEENSVDDSQNNDSDSVQSQNTNTDSNSSQSYSQYKNNTSYLTQTEVDSMSREELNLALNEIYARRGRIFKDPSLSAYFNSQSWYTPKYNETEFSQNVIFNDYEDKNIQLILNAQQSKGYR